MKTTELQRRFSNNVTTLCRCLLTDVFFFAKLLQRHDMVELRRDIKTTTLQRGDDAVCYWGASNVQTYWHVFTKFVFHLKTTIPGKRGTKFFSHNFQNFKKVGLSPTDENRIFFVRSPHHRHFGKAQHLVLWALWWHQLFSTR